MQKWNLLKKTAPCILSLAVAATTFPTAVMASDLDAAVVSGQIPIHSIKKTGSGTDKLAFIVNCPRSFFHKTKNLGNSLFDDL